MKKFVWVAHPDWVYAHPILNAEISILLVFLTGIFVYHLIEEPCAKYFSRKTQNAKFIKE